jgi:hypothetical protein
MNIEEILNQVQALRSSLDSWGITYEVLIGIGIVAGVLFLVSLREILLWYFKISSMVNELKALRHQVGEVQQEVGQTRQLIFNSTEGKKEESPAAATLKKKINLDH